VDRYRGPLRPVIIGGIETQSRQRVHYGRGRKSHNRRRGRESSREIGIHNVDGIGLGLHVGLRDPSPGVIQRDDNRSGVSVQRGHGILQIFQSSHNNFLLLFLNVADAPKSHKHYDD